jgi:hypothetical protein
VTGEKRALILLEEDVNRIVQALEPYQATTRTRANLLLDAEGHSLVAMGDARIPQETLAAFVAASVSATRPVRRALQEKQILTLTHGGKSASLQLSLVAPASDQLGTDVVLVTVFDQATTVAAVVFYLEPLVATLSSIVHEAAARKPSVDLGEGFGESAAGALDDMFGGDAAEANRFMTDETRTDEAGTDASGTDQAGTDQLGSDEPKAESDGEPSGGEDLTS